MKLLVIVFTTLYFLSISANDATDETDGNEEFEEPDKFSLTRIALTPDLVRIHDTDPVTFYDMKINFAYRYLLRNQACNYSEWSLLMPDFWDDYFDGTGDFDAVEQFGYHYWNVSVQFEPGEENTTVPGHCIHTEIVEDCTVEKKDQLKREQDLCFAGGLLECSNTTKTCVCLEAHGTETVRVNHRTGAPDPGGNACFVKEGEKCLIRHYGTPDLKLPCAYHYICDDFTETCQGHLKAY